MQFDRKSNCGKYMKILKVQGSFLNSLFNVFIASKFNATANTTARMKADNLSYAVSARFVI